MAFVPRNYGSGALTVTANGDVTGTATAGIYAPERMPTAPISA